MPKGQSYRAPKDRDQWEVHAMHNYEDSHDKFYAVRIDNIGGEKPFSVTASWGPAHRPREQANGVKGTFERLEDARYLVSRLLNDQRRKGYVDIEDPNYNPIHLPPDGDPKTQLNLKVVMDKIDTSRIVGFSKQVTTTISSFETDEPQGRAQRAINL